MHEGIRTIKCTAVFCFNTAPTDKRKDRSSTHNSFSIPFIPTLSLDSHLLLHLRNSVPRVQALGTCPCAVENSVATVQTH